MIDIKNKKYRLRDKRLIRLLCVVLPGRYPVVWHDDEDHIMTWTPEGEFDSHTGTHELDLVEILPYEDFVIDEPVMVKDCETEKWKRGYFAGVNRAGNPCTWQSGRTSWTEEDKSCWHECRRPTEEELKCRP